MDTLINIAINHILIKDMSNLLDFNLINQEFNNLKFTKNAYNDISEDKYFFNREIFANEKAVLIQECEAYLKNTNNSTAFQHLKMTESWGNLTPPMGANHLHQHPFSVVSGVIFLDDNPDNLLLNLEQYMQDVPYYIPVKWASVSLGRLTEGKAKSSNNLKNHLILFLSNVEHYVEQTSKDSMNRRSIAFNTFWQGLVGDSSPGSLGSIVF